MWKNGERDVREEANPPVLPVKVKEGAGGRCPADPLTLASESPHWTPDLPNCGIINMCVFLTTELVIICYNNNRKLME